MTSLDKMTVGKVGCEPSFGSSMQPDDEEEQKDNDGQKLLVPNQLSISKHWDRAITGMEQLIIMQGTAEELSSPKGSNPRKSVFKLAYDPYDDSLPVPTPVNERLLPGLHFA